jgi:hypothetical protein
MFFILGVEGRDSHYIRIFRQGKDIYVWRNLVKDTSEASLDAEAKFLLDFQRDMVKKYS